jgi:heme/copper-type cytochrome/quinol oxidase subunit 3
MLNWTVHIAQLLFLHARPLFHKKYDIVNAITEAASLHLHHKHKNCTNCRLLMVILLSELTFFFLFFSMVDCMQSSAIEGCPFFSQYSTEVKDLQMLACPQP